MIWLELYVLGLMFLLGFLVGAGRPSPLVVALWPVAIPVVVLCRWWRRHHPPPLDITFTVETAAFQKAMRGAADAVERYQAAMVQARERQREESASGEGRP